MKEYEIKSTLFSKEEIEKMVDNLAKKINEDYKDCESLCVIGVLKGAMIFMSDLIRKLEVKNVTIGFIKASSYGDSDVSSGNVHIGGDFDFNLSCKDLLIVEDIIDSGRTLKKLVSIFSDSHNVKTVALFDKPSRRCVDYDADYVGAVIPDQFIVGYGLDYAEKYRNLSYVAVLG